MFYVSVDGFTKAIEHGGMIRFVISPSLRSSNTEFPPHLSRAHAFKSAVLFLRHAKYSLHIVVQRQVYTWKLCLVNSHLQQRQHKWHIVCMQADMFIFKNVFLCIVWHLCHCSLLCSKIKKLKGKSKHGTWVMGQRSSYRGFQKCRSVKVTAPSSKVWYQVEMVCVLT